MSQPSIADQVGDFNPGFEDTVGPELSAVFAGEQADLRAGGVPSEAVAVGDALPDAQLLDADGRSVSLHAELAGRPAVLVFYRGAWCPYCSITLKHYEATLAAPLRERGVALLAISPQTPEGSAKAAAEGELSFTVLSDAGNALADRLGLVTAPSDAAQQAHTQLGFAVKDSNADDTPAIPFPTVLVVDGDGQIRFADIQVDYTQRTEAEPILSAVEAL